MTTAFDRRSVLAGALAVLGGCLDGGPGGTVTGTETDNPAVGPVTQHGDLALSSPAFADGASIPVAYSRDGENVNPPLRVSGVPERTGSLALVVDDPDAPGGPFVHWLVWNIDPAVRDIPPGWDPDATVGENDFGNRGYDGPDPPRGTHTYRFKLYALSTRLDLPTKTTMRELGRAMAGSVLAATQLTGEYGATG